MREARSMLARFGLALFCIYLVAGGISLMMAILQQLEWAEPITVGGLALFIAYLASLVFKDEIRRIG
jgi:uncharacterized membrane protein